MTTQVSNRQRKKLEALKKRRQPLEAAARAAEPEVSEQVALATADQHLRGMLNRMRTAFDCAKQASARARRVAPDAVQAVTVPHALPVHSYPPASEFDDFLAYIHNLAHTHAHQVGQSKAAPPPRRAAMRFRFGCLPTPSALSLAVREDVPCSAKDDLMSSVREEQARCTSIEQELAETRAEIVRVSSRQRRPAANVRFAHGTVCGDGRLDLCKQGIRQAFEASTEAVIADAPPPAAAANVRFAHGTVCGDGRLDLRKQGIRQAFEASTEA